MCSPLYESVRFRQWGANAKKHQPGSSCPSEHRRAVCEGLCTATNACLTHETYCENYYYSRRASPACLLIYLFGCVG